MLKNTLLITLLIVSFSSQAELVGYWTFEDGLTDSSGNGYDGVVSNSNTELDILGTEANHYVNFGDNSIALPMYYDSEIESLGLSIWFNTSYSSPEYEYDGYDKDTHVYDSAWTSYINSSLIDFDRSDYYSLVVTGNGEIMFSYSSKASGTWDLYDIVAEGDVAYNDGEWHKVNVNYSEDGGLQIYVDAELILSEIYTGYIGGVGNTRYGFIGDNSEAETFNSGSNNLYYNGMIDNVAIYDDAIAEEVIIDSYAAEVSTYYDVPLFNAPSSLCLLFLFRGRKNRGSRMRHAGPRTRDIDN